MEELAHEADVGDGQAKGLDAGETLFVRECWYLGERTKFKFRIIFIVYLTFVQKI